MYKYEVIGKDIRDRIINGDFKTNDKLPDENSLSITYDCSRMTIKKAMDNLVNEGFIVKSRGSGTFIRQQVNKLGNSKIFSNSPTTFGFSNTFKKEKIKTKVNVFKVIECDKDVSIKLQLSEGSFVYYVERIRFINDKPIILEFLYIPIDKIAGLSKDILEKSFYNYVEEKLKIKIYNADKVIRAKLADDKDQENLEMKIGEPILEMDHIVYSTSNTPIEYARIHYKGDSYELHFITKKE